jgi:hypothetical protein
MTAGDYTAMMGIGGDGFKLAQAAGAVLQNPSPGRHWRLQEGHGQLRIRQASWR